MAEEMVTMVDNRNLRAIIHEINNTPYYVMSYEYFEDVERKREVSIKLIGVPQHKEMMRRIKNK